MANPPSCIGTYLENDQVCNGDQFSSDPAEALPCAWRPRCIGLKKFLEDTGTKPSDVVGKCPTEDLVELCRIGGYSEEQDKAPDQTSQAGPETPEEPQESPAEAAPIPEEPVAQKATTVEPEKPKAKNWNNPHRRRRKPSRKRRRTSLGPEVLELGDYFRALLQETFPRQRLARKSEVVARPGTFYALDRKKEGHYVRWYCSVRKGHDQGIACLKFKPRKKKLDVTLPVSIRELECLAGEEDTKILNPKNTRDGQFMTICRNIDKEGIKVCMRVLRELADNGSINVPTGDK